MLKREDLTHTGLAQDQQRARPGAAHPAHGQAAGHRGDRRRPARRRDRDRPPRCSGWTASCSWVRWTSSARRSNVFRMELLGAEVIPVSIGQRDAQGRDQRRVAGLGRVGREHALLHRFGRRSASRTRGSCASSSASSVTRRASSAAPILGGDDPDYVVACVGGGSNAIGTFAGFIDTDRQARRRRGGGSRPGVGQARRFGQPGRARASSTAPARCSSRTRTARSSKPTRSAPGSTIRASVRSTPRSPRPGRATYGFADRRGGARGVRAAEPRPRASCRRSSRLTRSAGSPVRSASSVAAGVNRARHALRARRQGRDAGGGAVDRRAARMKLEASRRKRRDEGRKLLVPYVTGGLGAAWLDVVRAVALAGADAIEIGIPFSDPVMDGRTIQEASQRALDLGATPAGIAADLAGVRHRRPARRDDLLQPGSAHGPRAVRGGARRWGRRRRDRARPAARRARRLG